MKRILSLVLMLSMLACAFTVIPTGASAAEGSNASAGLPYAGGKTESNSYTSAAPGGDDVQETGDEGIVPVEFDMEDTLYVTKGLTVLLSAYKTVITSYNEETGEWENGVTGNNYAKLVGTGWTANAGGGITIQKTVDDYIPPQEGVTSLYNTKEDYALVFDTSMVPTGSYTVEYVANPVGISNEDGTRYIDATSKFGIYHENAIAIGPLRAMQFNAGRPGMKAFERRWVYGKGQNPYNDACAAGTAIGGVGNLPGYKQDYEWDGIGLHQIVTSAITLNTALESGNHEYGFYTDLSKVGSAMIAKADILTPAQADNMFRLMGGFAGTVYAARVYNRVLNEEEMAQNHFADLVYYYGIDVTVLRQAMAAMDDISAITSAFVDMGFDLTKEEAEKQFNDNLTEIWLSYAGFGVRKDMTDGLRFYFDISKGGIQVMETSGAVVEIGAIINIGKNAVPVLDGNGYDYKIVAFDSVMGRESEYYVDADTFAVTIRYDNANREALLSNIFCQGYVKLTLADGTASYYYLDIGSIGAPTYLFQGYDTMADNNTFADSKDLAKYVGERIESCYTTTYVHLDAAAAEGGNGSAETPYKYFEDAFAASKEFLRAANVPTHVILSAKDGMYSVSEAQVLTSEDKSYAYCDFTILSENGGSILSTLVDISGSFASQGNNVYTYQFEKDAEGNYPTFRYLFVNGEKADIAYNGGKYATTEAMTLTAFDRPFEGVWATSIDDAMAGTLTFTSAVPANYADREDLTELYEYYRPRAIAYAQVVKLYEGLSHTTTNFSMASKKLQNATANLGSDEVYKEAFAHYKALYLGRYEAECESRKVGVNSSAFRPNFTRYVTIDEDPQLYAYQQTRHLLYWNGIPLDLPMDMKAGGDGKSLGKFYLAESLIGETAVEIAANSGDAFKTALEGYGIEINLTFQYMQNTMDLLGVDVDDFYVDENGETHYACYLERYEYMQVPSGGNGPMTTAGHFVYAQNSLAYLDQENEFYYDEATGTLYYYSESGVDGKTFARPTSDYLLKFDGVTDVAVKNFNFTGTDDYFMTVYGHHGSLGGGDHDEEGAVYAGYFPTRSAIFMRDVQNAQITGCDFYELGCEGITARGWMMDVTVEECTFEAIGASAIRFGENIREYVMEPWQEGIEGNTRIYVLNNYLKDISTEYLCAAIQLTTAYESKVQRNTIDDCAYSGISVGWQWAYSTVRTNLIRNVENTEISNNFLSGFMNESHDGGAIYLAGPNTTTDDSRIFNSIHDNYILYSADSGDGTGSFAAGLYFDGASSSYRVYDNVIVAPAYGAAEGETDYDDYGITAEEAARLAATRKGATYIYLQHITNQVVNNIVLENNIILNVRATKVDDQRTEVYKKYLANAAGKNVTDNDSTIYSTDITDIPRDAARIIMSAGASKHTGVPNDIMDNVY